MRLIILSLVAMFSLAACGTISEKEPVVTHVKQEGPVGESVAKLHIEGMMCEIGCASKVKKELLELPGVSSVEIDFSDDREVDFAIVEFTSGHTDAKALYSQVNKIADGRLYGVTAVEITEYSPKAE